MSEKIPCPVPGCDEVFDDEAAVIKHIKKEHKDEFGPAPTPKLPPNEPPEGDVQKGPDDLKKDLDVALSMVPPGMMKALEDKMDERIGAALEAFMPQVQQSVAGAIKQVIDNAQKAGLSIPGVTGSTVKEGGVIQGSPVTSEGAALIQLLMGGGGGGDIESFIRQANQYRALGDLFNPPPSLLDRIAQRALMKQFKSLNLITDQMMDNVDKELDLKG